MGHMGRARVGLLDGDELEGAIGFAVGLAVGLNDRLNDGDLDGLEVGDFTGESDG